MYIHSGAPRGYETQKAPRQLRLVYHPGLQERDRAWGFKGGEENSQEGEKRKRIVNKLCLVM